MIGRVVSTSSIKTAAVLVERTAIHPLYKKTFVRTKTYLVDDPIGVKIGDIVSFINCKPVSKRKAWRVVKVLGKDIAEIAGIELKEAAEEIISEVMPEESSANSENLGKPVNQNSGGSDKFENTDTLRRSEKKKASKKKETK
ncbi:mitochondrial small ribosomal subunit protein uS17m [Candidatus Daviesbacteria bacterium]|nr:mitochondrial small ribosomal subunit protein uS17m [Candidatus Daviesbacteria bacterium]